MKIIVMKNAMTDPTNKSIFVSISQMMINDWLCANNNQNAKRYYKKSQRNNLANINCWWKIKNFVLIVWNCNFCNIVWQICAVQSWWTNHLWKLPKILLWLWCWTIKSLFVKKLTICCHFLIFLIFDKKQSATINFEMDFFLKLMFDVSKHKTLCHFLEGGKYKKKEGETATILRLCEALHCAIFKQQQRKRKRKRKSIFNHMVYHNWWLAICQCLCFFYVFEPKHNQSASHNTKKLWKHKTKS